MCQRIRLKCFIWWCRNDLHRARLLCFQKRNEVLSRWTYNEHPACLAKLKNRHPAQCPNMRVVKCQVQIFKTQKQHWQQLWLWSSLWLIPYDWASNMGSKQQEAKQREMNVCLCLCELFFFLHCCLCLLSITCVDGAEQKGRKKEQMKITWVGGKNSWITKTFNCEASFTELMDFLTRFIQGNPH